MLNHLKNSVLKMKALTRLYTDSYGPMNSNYLRRSLDVVSGTLARYPRVYALRVDLRFASESPEDDTDTLTCEPVNDSV